MSQSPKVVGIVGGGLSGLSAAWQLARTSPQTKIVLFEKSSRVGGWIETRGETEHAVLEQGPHSIRPNGKISFPMAHLVSSLGIADQVLKADEEKGGKRFLYFQKDIVAVPYSFDGLLSTPIGRVLLKGVWRDIRQGLIPFFFPSRPSSKTSSEVDKMEHQDETVYQFSARKFGKEFTDAVITAMCHGIYSGDSRKLSVSACFPILKDLEKKSGGGSVILGGLTLASSLKKSKVEDQKLLETYPQETQTLVNDLAKAGAWSFKNGTQTLINALESDLSKNHENVTILKDSECSSITQDTSNRFNLLISNKEYTVDRLISALPAPKLSSALSKDTKNVNEDFQKALDFMHSIPFSTVGLANFVFDGPVVPKEKQGFGYLIPSREMGNSSVIGVIFHSQVFPNQKRPTPDCERVTVMMAASENESEAKITAHALQTLREHLKIPNDKLPIVARSQLLKDCIPQYQVGHVENVEKLDKVMEEQFHGYLALIGNSYHGVSVNDCVRFGFEGADKIAKTL